MRRINYGNEKLGGPKIFSQFYGQVKIGVKIFYLTHKRIFSNPNSNEVFNFLGNFSWNTKVSKYNRGVGWLWSADANVTSSNPTLHRLSEKPLSSAGCIPETFETGSPGCYQVFLLWFWSFLLKNLPIFLLVRWPWWKLRWPISINLPRSIQSRIPSDIFNPIGQ